MPKRKLIWYDKVAWLFTVAGALNWGLYAVARINVVTLLPTPMAQDVAYLLVGFSALYLVWDYFGRK